MKKIFICTSLLSLAFIIFGCDETSAPASIFDDVPSIASIDVEPDTVQFNAEEDGFKDTTLLVSIFIFTVNTPDEELPVYVLSDKESGELVTAGTFEMSNSRSGNFRIEIPLETSTTSFKQFTITAYPSANIENGNFAQASLRINGISSNPPQILETDNPNEIHRPSSGYQNITFTAKVTDEDGQDTIENVFMKLISQTNGEVSNSPFPLYDDGTNGGDETAKDSLYTLTFQINDQNQPDTYSLEYFAVDQGGLVSDTVTSTFSIID